MASPGHSIERTVPPERSSTKGHYRNRHRSKATTTMTDQQNLEPVRPASADPAVALAEMLGQLPKPVSDKPVVAKTSVEELAQELGLKLGDQNELTIRRIKRGKSYSFVRANGTRIK